MRLSEIKTMDELREFAKSEAFYSVRSSFPFGVDAYWASSRNLRIDIAKDGRIFWTLENNMSPDRTEELFDNEREAETHSLIARSAYLEIERKKIIERLEQLNREENANEVRE